MIIGDCRGLVANNYLSIQLVKRHANRPTHCLARATHSHLVLFFRFLFPLF